MNSMATMPGNHTMMIHWLIIHVFGLTIDNFKCFCCIPYDICYYSLNWFYSASVWTTLYPLQFLYVHIMRFWVKSNAVFIRVLYCATLLWHGSSVYNGHLSKTRDTHTYFWRFSNGAITLGVKKCKIDIFL